MKTDIPMSGPVVTKHISFKTVDGYGATRRTTCRTWSQVYPRLLLHRARLLPQLQHHQRRILKVQYPIQHHPDVRVRVDWHGETRRIPIHQNGCKSSKENLVDEGVPEHRESHLSSSHELPSEPQRQVVSGKHSVKNSLPERPKLRDLPEDQNHKGSLQKTHW